MKKILFVLVAVMLFVAACGNNEEAPKEEMQEDVTLAPSITGDKTEGFKLVHEQAHDTVVYEDETFTITLTQSIHGRSNVRDLIELKFDVENNSDEPHNINFDKVLFDGEEVEGSKISMFGTNVNENGTTVIDVMVANENELSFKKAISAELRMKNEDSGDESIEFNAEIEYD